MPAYLQSTAAECGLACLGFVAAAHGNVLDMSQLRAKFSISIRGASVADLIRFCTQLDLSARALRLEMEALEKLSTPCILHWDMNHFVVLTKVARGRIFLFDPASGARSMSLVEAGRHFTGVALELTPAPGFEKKAPAPHVSWRQIVGPVVGFKRSISQVFIIALTLQLIMLIAPLFTQWIVDGAILSTDFTLLWVLLIGAVLVNMIRIGLDLARGWLGIVASTQFGIQWAARVMAHLLSLPVQWFECRHTGDVISRFQSVQSIQQIVTGKLVEVMLDGLLAVLLLIVMLFYSPKLAAVVVAAIVLYAAIRILPHSSFHRISDEALTYEAQAQTYFMESLRAIPAIKLRALEEQRAARWLNLSVQATNRRMLTQKLSLGFGAGYGLVSGLENVAILGWGAAMVIDGKLTVGMLMAFISYKGEFSSRMQQFIDNMMSMRLLRMHTERLADIVLVDREKTAGVMPDGAFEEVSVLPSISFENVSFRYGDSTPWILRNTNLTIAAGEHVAIVGPTGLGKTTLVKLMLGLLIPTEGTIKVDGIPLMHMGLSNWRRMVGAILQEDQLFSASLQENIACFDEKIDLDRVQRAARLAAIHAEIIAMPMGYHTLNGESGSGLSSGQRQRILLARALYRQPKVLVLDEATSHLDVHTERSVVEAIDKLSVTRITIAHRPQTIAMAHRVIDMTCLHASTHQ